MATTNKDFRVKNGLVVEGSTSTVNGNQVLTTASSLDSLSDVVITTPTTSQVLLYNGTNWINSSSGGGGTTTNALTIGTGLSGTSFNGSTAVTIAIDSTVATLTGTQTLTNKTLTSPTLTTPSIGVATGTSFNSITGLSATTPSANGSAAVGTATTTARADHVHPTTGLGLTASGLNQFAATTSAQLAGVISDETGSGALVFATSPTLTTPSIGVATGTSFNSITGLSSTTPSALGSAAVGTATTTARADHVHPTATTVVATVSGTNSAELVRGNMGDNDNFRILVGATATNAGFAEIATADDGTEPIFVRQYTGAFATITRTLTLLDGSGNTSLPGSISASSLAGSLLTSTVGTALGTASAGSATVPARADHVHPTTGLALLSGASFTGLIVGKENTGGTILNSNDSGSISIRGNATTQSAAMSFHRTGNYAINMGLDTDNNFKIGGWSANAIMMTLTPAGNLTVPGVVTGSSFSGNATTATGLNASNYIARTGSSGNLNTDFQNTPAGTTRHQGDDSSLANSPGNVWWFYQNMRHSNGGNFWGTQVAWGWEDNANRLATRNITSNNFGGWVYYINNVNHNTYGLRNIQSSTSGPSGGSDGDVWIQYT